MKKLLLIAPVLFFALFFQPAGSSLSAPAAVNCSTIGNNGTIYENTLLTDDLYSTGNCLTIGADNIVLDCNGHSLQGGGGAYGVYLNNKNGITIKNCNMGNFQFSIFAGFEGTSNNDIIQNNILNSYFAISPDSTQNTISQNVFNTRIWIDGNFNTFDSNTFNQVNTGNPIILMPGNNNNLLNNIFNGQGYDYGIYNPSSSQNNTFINNTIQGFVTGLQICDTYGEETCGGNVITGNTFINNGVGMAIGEGDLNTISNNYIDSNLPELYELRALKGDYSPITLKDGTELTMEWGVELTYSHNNIMWLNNLYDQNNIWDVENNLYCFDGEGNFYNFEIDENCQGDCIIPDCSEILNNNGQWGYSGGKQNPMVDNFDNIFTWNRLPNGPGWSEYLYSDAVEGDFELSAPQGRDSFAWRVYTLPNKYRVSVWKFDHPYSNYMARSAQYQIYHANGVDTVYVNQASPGDGWITLGEYTFDNLNMQRGVLLTDDGSNGMILADAIKIENIGPPEYYR